MPLSPRTLRLLTLSAALAMGASAAQHPSKPPDLVEFEGKLSDASGNALDGSFLLKFELYDAPEGGERRWDESLYVNARAGRYRAELGRIKPIPPGVFAAGYRLIVSPPEGTGWVAAGVKPPQQIAGKPAPRPAPPAAEESAPAPKVKIIERAAPAQLAVSAPEPAASRAKAGAVYEVRPGDTLKSVALKLYGDAARWVELYQANDDRILRGGDLVPGQRLIVPGEGGKAPR